MKITWESRCRTGHGKSNLCNTYSQKLSRCAHCHQQQLKRSFFHLLVVSPFLGIFSELKCRQDSHVTISSPVI